MEAERPAETLAQLLERRGELTERVVAMQSELGTGPPPDEHGRSMRFPAIREWRAERLARLAAETGELRRVNARISLMRTSVSPAGADATNHLLRLYGILKAWIAEEDIGPDGDEQRAIDAARAWLRERGLVG